MFDWPLIWRLLPKLFKKVDLVDGAGVSPADQPWPSWPLVGADLEDVTAGVFKGVFFLCFQDSVQLVMFMGN